MKRQALKAIAIVEPGNLWVRTEDGVLRRATEEEVVALLKMVPDLALQIGWRDTVSEPKAS